MESLHSMAKSVSPAAKVGSNPSTVPNKQCEPGLLSPCIYCLFKTRAAPSPEHCENRRAVHGTVEFGSKGHMI